jgi:uncharacterized protein YaaQ
MTDKPAASSSKLRPITKLMAVVIQVQDLNNAARALGKAGLTVTRLASTGAFLERRNATLLIGLAEGQEPLAIEAIQQTCHQRVQYISTPLEGAPMPIPLSTPVQVGGASIFTFDVERYEEI